jgi:hypothetical protein
VVRKQDFSIRVSDRSAAYEKLQDFLMQKSNIAFLVWMRDQGIRVGEEGENTCGKASPRGRTASEAFT